MLVELRAIIAGILTQMGNVEVLVVDAFIEDGRKVEILVTNANLGFNLNPERLFGHTVDVVVRIYSDYFYINPRPLICVDPLEVKVVGMVFPPPDSKATKSFLCPAVVIND